MEDLSSIYSKFVISDRILDEELLQIKELLVGISTLGTKTFILWFQGVESSEMTHRESILKNFARIGLVDLEWKFTHHNAYIKTRITDKGMRLIQTMLGVLPKMPLS